MTYDDVILCHPPPTDLLVVLSQESVEILRYVVRFIFIRLSLVERYVTTADDRLQLGRRFVLAAVQTLSRSTLDQQRLIV